MGDDVFEGAGDDERSTGWVVVGGGGVPDKSCFLNFFSFFFYLVL